MGVGLTRGEGTQGVLLGHRHQVGMAGKEHIGF